jgi:hypothetical protein
MSNPSYVALAAGLALFAVAQPADAASVFVANHSFEADKLGDGQFRNGYAPSGWSSGYAEPSGPANPLAGDFNEAVPDGENVMFSATGYDGSPYYQGNVFQQVLDGVAANTRYTLMVDIGRATYIDMADFAVQLVGGSDLTSVFASGSFLSDDIASGEFRTLTLTFDTAAAFDGPFGIRLRTFHNPAQGQGQRVTYFDNVRLDASPLATAAVPEPSSWALMILGAGLSGAALRRSAVRQRLAGSPVA